MRGEQPWSEDSSWLLPGMQPAGWRGAAPDRRRKRRYIVTALARVSASGWMFEQEHGVPLSTALASIFLFFYAFILISDQLHQMCNDCRRSHRLQLNSHRNLLCFTLVVLHFHPPSSGSNICFTLWELLSPTPTLSILHLSPSAPPLTMKHFALTLLHRGGGRVRDRHTLLQLHLYIFESV